MYFYLSNSDHSENFIKFIKMIESKEGYYFNNHYMHERIKISIDAYPNVIEELYPYVDILKSITAFDEYNINQIGNF